METGAIHDSGLIREEDDGYELQLASMERVPASVDYILLAPGRSRTIISQESISKPKEGCNSRTLSKKSMWNHVSFPQAPVEVKQLGKD